MGVENVDVSAAELSRKAKGDRRVVSETPPDAEQLHLGRIDAAFHGSAGLKGADGGRELVGRETVAQVDDAVLRAAHAQVVDDVHHAETPVWRASGDRTWHGAHDSFSFVSWYSCSVLSSQMFA